MAAAVIMLFSQTEYAPALYQCNLAGNGRLNFL